MWEDMTIALCCAGLLAALVLMLVELRAVLDVHGWTARQHNDRS